MTLRHKHLRLDQSKIDRARRFLGARTEQDTLDQALDAVLAEERILRTYRRIRRQAKITPAFDGT